MAADMVVMARANATAATASATAATVAPRSRLPISSIESKLRMPRMSAAIDRC